MTTPRSPHARRAIVFGTAAAAVYCVMVFGTLAKLETVSGLTPFDMRPAGYGFVEAKALLTALGEAGRQTYLHAQLPLDLLYPALMALTLTSLWRLAGNSQDRARVVGVGVAATWLAAGLDYAENAGIAAMLLLWPDVPDALIRVASLATVAKSTTTTVAILGLVAFGGWRFWYCRRTSKAA